MTGIVSLAIAALLTVESGNVRSPADGDGGRAVGVLQQWPISVREANRIAGTRRWTYADRRCPEKAVEMCRVTLLWHWRRGVRDPVDLACRWRNPNGNAPPWYRKRIREAIKGNR